MSLKEVAETALNLPTEQRAFLAEKLLASLDSEEDFAINEAWLGEIKRRCEDLDAGAKTIPADEVFTELRSELA